MTFKEMYEKYGISNNPMFVYNGIQYIIPFRRKSDKTIIYDVDFYYLTYFKGEYFKICYGSVEDMEKEFPYDDYEICDVRTIIAMGKITTCDYIKPFDIEKVLDVVGVHHYLYETLFNQFKIGSSEYFISYQKYNNILKDNKFRKSNGLPEYYLGRKNKDTTLFIKLYMQLYNHETDKEKYIAKAFHDYMRQVCSYMNDVDENNKFQYHAFKKIYC